MNVAGFILEADTIQDDTSCIVFGAVIAPCSIPARRDDGKANERELGRVGDLAGRPTPIPLPLRHEQGVLVPIAGGLAHRIAFQKAVGVEVP